jgi:hypothetical protein
MAKARAHSRRRLQVPEGPLRPSKRGFTESRPCRVGGWRHWSHSSCRPHRFRAKGHPTHDFVGAAVVRAEQRVRSGQKRAPLAIDHEVGRALGLVNWSTPKSGSARLRSHRQAVKFSRPCRWQGGRRDQVVADLWAGSCQSMSPRGLRRLSCLAGSRRRAAGVRARRGGLRSLLGENAESAVARHHLHDCDRTQSDGGTEGLAHQEAVPTTR